jgi:hypothetical protein
MATVSRFKIGSIFMQPGQVVGAVWNNTPRDLVVLIDCTPTTFANTGTAEIQLVRTWNQRRTGGQDAERRFFFEFKNIGTSPASAEVYMAQIN